MPLKTGPSVPDKNNMSPMNQRASSLFSPKRIVLHLLVVLATFCFLAGCSGGGERVGSSSSSAPPPPSGAPLPTPSPAIPSSSTRQQLFAQRFGRHFVLGIDAPIAWLHDSRATSGAHWDARVQYLSGGVGHADPPWWIRYGPFVDTFIAECETFGCVPWLTWYMLAQSRPADYRPGPAQATPANAKAPATMKAYFETFKYLMAECAKHSPYPVVIHIEPDEWGHLLIPAGMDPAKVEVRVGSCGLDELADLPDDLFGFAQALKRLRDRYAPDNVFLACNPSGWDWQNTMTGTVFGALMKRVCGDWELAVFETGDRDKGMSGQTPPHADRIDITGSFDNHLRWITDFHAASGLKVIVWQAAMGNTFFATCNNTPGHYTDNLAPTLLENYPANAMIERYARAGCVGWMFNAGQADSTHVHDQRNDGVTNPPPIPGNRGQTATFADDDGGYLRLRAGAYYQAPFALPGN